MTGVRDPVGGEVRRAECELVGLQRGEQVAVSQLTTNHLNSKFDQIKLESCKCTAGVMQGEQGGQTLIFLTYFLTLQNLAPTARSLYNGSSRMGQISEEPN